MSDYYVLKRYKRQFDAFAKGFHRVIPQQLAHLFSPAELGLVISGNSNPISIPEWKKNTIYKHCSAGDAFTTKFWRCVERMTEQERENLLFFTTSLSKVLLSLKGHRHVHIARTLTLLMLKDNTKHLLCRC